jgi:phosphoribosylanthranilate isomerase
MIRRAGFADKSAAFGGRSGTVGLMFVKICGITNEEDALFAVAMGADAVGFLFAPSTRQIQPARARDIVRRLPHETLTIGVFRDETPQRVAEVVNLVGLGGAQLHGRESAAEVAWVRERVGFVVKAFSADDPFFAKAGDYDVDAVMIDSSVPGSGTVFDWSLAENLPLTQKLILAGGLTHENVRQAIQQVRPWGVDVSTGVERAPGHKDASKVMRFVTAAKELDDTPRVEIDLDDDGRPLVEPYDFDWEEDTSVT